MVLHRQAVRRRRTLLLLLFTAVLIATIALAVTLLVGGVVAPLGTLRFTRISP